MSLITGLFPGLNKVKRSKEEDALYDKASLWQEIFNKPLARDISRANMLYAGSDKLAAQDLGQQLRQIDAIRGNQDTYKRGLAAQTWGNLTPTEQNEFGTPERFTLNQIGAFDPSGMMREATAMRGIAQGLPQANIDADKATMDFTKKRQQQAGKVIDLENQYGAPEASVYARLLGDLSGAGKDQTFLQNLDQFQNNYKQDLDLQGLQSRNSIYNQRFNVPLQNSLENERLLFNEPQHLKLDRTNTSNQMDIANQQSELMPQTLQTMANQSTGDLFRSSFIPSDNQPQFLSPIRGQTIGSTMPNPLAVTPQMKMEQMMRSQVKTLPGMGAIKSVNGQPLTKNPTGWTPDSGFQPSYMAANATRTPQPDGYAPQPPTADPAIISREQFESASKSIPQEYQPKLRSALMNAIGEELGIARASIGSSIFKRSLGSTVQDQLYNNPEFAKRVNALTPEQQSRIYTKVLSQFAQ